MNCLLALAYLVQHGVIGVCIAPIRGCLPSSVFADVFPWNMSPALTHKFFPTVFAILTLSPRKSFFCVWRICGRSFQASEKQCRFFCQLGVVEALEKMSTFDTSRLRNHGVCLLLVASDFFVLRFCTGTLFFICFSGILKFDYAWVHLDLLEWEGNLKSTLHGFA